MALEDFTTYTEVDASARLTVTASKATGVNVDRDIDVYLHFDKGVDNYDVIDIDFEIQMESASIQGCQAGMGLTVSAISTINGFGTTDVSVALHKPSGSPVLRLIRGNEVAIDFFTAAFGTRYFCSLLRTAGSDTITCEIYSDSDRTTLLDTLTLSGFGTGTKYRRLYGFVNRNDGTAGDDFDGFIENMEDLSNPSPGGSKMLRAFYQSHYEKIRGILRPKKGIYLPDGSF